MDLEWDLYYYNLGSFVPALLVPYSQGQDGMSDGEEVGDVVERKWVGWAHRGEILIDIQIRLA